MEAEKITVIKPQSIREIGFAELQFAGNRHFRVGSTI